MGQAPSIFTVQFSSVAPSCRFFATPWVAAHQASLSITNSWNLLKLMSIKSVMPSNHLILCCPLLLLPSILPSIKVFSNESVLCIRWPKFQLQHQSFHDYSGLISFRIDWFDLLAVQGTLKSLLRHHNSKASGWQRTALTYSFPNLEPVCCSMSGSNYCFLTCIQISQETCRVVWYSRLFKNFPQLIVIHTVKGFGLVNKAEIDVFLEFTCFLNDPTDIGNLLFGSSAFSKSSLNIWKFTVHILLKPGLENFEHYFTSMWDECNCVVVWTFFGIAFLWDWNENWPFPVLWLLLRFPNLLAYWVRQSSCLDDDFTASSFRIWNSSTRIPSPPLAL